MDLDINIGGRTVDRRRGGGKELKGWAGIVFVVLVLGFFAVSFLLAGDQEIEPDPDKACEIWQDIEYAFEFREITDRSERGIRDVVTYARDTELEEPAKDLRRGVRRGRISRSDVDDMQAACEPYL